MKPFSGMPREHNKGAGAAGGAAARSISMRIVAAMSVITLIGTLMLVSGIILGSRHEFSEHGINPNAVNVSNGHQGIFVIDSRKAIEFIVLFAVCIIVATGLVGWYFSRKEIEPIQEALRLQRDFVADASHELKAPLAVIGVRTELLDQHLHRGKSVEPIVNDLHDDVNRMGQIINDLLLAAQSASRVAPIDLVQAVQAAIDSLSPLARHKNIRITGEFPKTPVMVSGGETSLSRCFVAVIDNAIAHSPDGSVIEVEVHARCRIRHGWLHAIRSECSTGNGRKRYKAHNAAYAQVWVRDYGEGIEGDSERLFRRFSRADTNSNHQGYGLGLALARDIVMRYGGTIEVAPTAGTGTTICISFPLMPECAQTHT